MMFINKVILSGIISSPPELKELIGGKKLITFSIKTTEKFIDKNNIPVEEDYYHRVVAWDKMALNIKNNLREGDNIFIEGKLKTRSYTDKSTQTKKITEVLISEFRKL